MARASHFSVKRPNPVSPMTRAARVLLNPEALRHNLRQVREHAPRARVMAIVKANGYGHGLEWVVSVLREADAFGVASADEGVRLRAAGFANRHPVCLLEGFFDAQEFPLLVQHRLSPVIHHEQQIGILESERLESPMPIWIKLDSGMHRLGFAPDRLADILARLKNCAGVGEIHVLSHLANADDRNDPTTRAQIKTLLAHAGGRGLALSLANSAGVMAWPESHLDWVRPGIMLYGASPLTGVSAAQLKLKPVMTLASKLIAVHQRRRGDPVGYGGDWRCPADMPVGVVAMGYGDGYPRHVPPGTPVLINEKPVALIGRVSMDVITVDLRAQPAAKVGDPVVLWGAGLPVDDIAAKAGTISYELLCQVSERVPRIVIESGASADGDDQFG